MRTIPRNRNEFVEWFVDAYGYVPTEEVIREYTGGEAGDVYGQVREIFREVVRTVRKSSGEKAAFAHEELLFMLLLFGAKAALYFILKESIARGYDLSEF